MLTDYECQDEFRTNYRYAHDYWVPFVKDAQVYTLAASGYTWSDQERKELIKQGREPIEYNIIRRPLQFFSGYLRDNINEIIYGPVEGSDQKTADQFTKLGYYIWDKGNGFPTFLDAADECFKSGMSLCGLHMDYSKDFINGDLAFHKRTYNSFYLDPTFENINLSDCAFAITRDLIDKQYAKQLLPFIDPQVIEDLQNSYKDDKFLQYHPQFTTFSRNRNLIAYDQYYRRHTKKREFLCDMKSSYYRDITDISKEEKDKLKMGLRRLDEMRRDADMLDIPYDQIPQVEIRSVDRGFVELNIMLNGTRVYCGEDKTGINETYPFVPLLCYMEPSIWMPSQRVQGISAVNWSLQRQFNKRHMKITDMMDSTISTGFKYLIGSVPDPQDMQQSGQNKLIGIDPENAPMGLDSVQELRGGGANPDLMAYQTILDQLSLTLSNVNESSMGIDEKGNTQVSGRLAQVRIAQGLRGNRKIIDNVETSQQVLGGLVLIGIQKNYPAGKVERILGEAPTEQFYEGEFEQYDAVIKEGVRSKSQKDAYYYELVSLKKDGIVNVPEAEIVRALQMSGVSDLQEAIEKQDEGMAERAKMAAQVEQVQLEKLNSEKEANLGLAQERRSRVISNLSLKDERESEAQQNIAQASLDRARAMSEIAKLREDRILRVLQFVNEMESQEAMGREAQKNQVGSQADQINTETQGSSENMQQQEAMQQMQQSEQMNNQAPLGG
tara:strand:+ start:1280 stop:3451 length:2172 start_codon:yes stop_codon:yes gene_type:complete